MTKLEVFLVVLIACSVLAYFYVTVISQPVFEVTVHPFKEENMTILEEETSNTINNATSVDTDLNSTIGGDNSNG